MCDHCSTLIQTWNDGNPYFYDEDSVKRYAYHPDGLRDRYVANDFEHLCLGCGERFMVDNRAPLVACLKCSSDNIVGLFMLEGKQCPFFKSGTFVRDLDAYKS